MDAIPAHSPTRVDVNDCASDANWLPYVAATGKQKDATIGGHRSITARVMKQNNLWLATSYSVQAEGTC